MSSYGIHIKTQISLTRSLQEKRDFNSLLKALSFVKVKYRQRYLFVILDSDITICPKCKSPVKKHGFQPNGKQKYFCKNEKCECQFTCTNNFPDTVYSPKDIIDGLRYRYEEKLSYANISKKLIEIGITAAGFTVRRWDRDYMAVFRQLIEYIGKNQKTNVHLLSDLQNYSWFGVSLPKPLITTTYNEKLEIKFNAPITLTIKKDDRLVKNILMCILLEERIGKMNEIAKLFDVTTKTLVEKIEKFEKDGSRGLIPIRKVEEGYKATPEVVGKIIGRLIKCTLSSEKATNGYVASLVNQEIKDPKKRIGDKTVNRVRNSIDWDKVDHILGEELKKKFIRKRKYRKI